MNEVTKPAQAGTLESNDVVVTVAPVGKGSGITIEMTSIVMAQFGAQIKKVVEDTVKEQGLADAFVKINDRGALDCTIRARVLTALSRGGAAVKEAMA
ncbi:MAG: citrate lyase acyl carrier protein [Negativicutes bacterium]|nr:citrate lyase acyl carrier protein [Negativicutes bacterium]